MRWLPASIVAGLLAAASLHAPDRWLSLSFALSALAVLAIAGLDQPSAPAKLHSPLWEWLPAHTSRGAGKAVRHG